MDSFRQIVGSDLLPNDRQPPFGGFGEGAVTTTGGRPATLGLLSQSPCVIYGESSTTTMMSTMISAAAAESSGGEQSQEDDDGDGDVVLFSETRIMASIGQYGAGGKPKEQKVLRLNTNARERRRMHDLNDALDELRSVIPYAHSPSVRKLSKIATLLLAKNYILMQSQAIDEMKRLVTYLNQGQGGMVANTTPGLGFFDQQISEMPNSGAIFNNPAGVLK